MNCASVTMPASRSRRMARLFCSIVVSLLKRSSFNCAAASVPRLTCTRPARRNIGSSCSSRRMSVTRVLMPHCTLAGRPRAMSSSQKAMNFLRWIVGSSSARMKKPTPWLFTRSSISSTTALGSRMRYSRQNFHWLQKVQVNGQPRAKLGMATRTPSGM